MSAQKIYHLLLCLLLCSSIFAQENDAITCSDGIDNDNDGLIDCMDDDCKLLGMNSCATCLNNGLSFADTLLDYTLTCNESINANVNRSIGLSDVSNVSLGEGGSLTLGFTNNVLSNSGDIKPDIWIFETGMFVEETEIELLPIDEQTIELLINANVTDIDGDGYYDFGVVKGATSSIDIDQIVPNIDQGILKFNAIQVTDVPMVTCEESIPVGFKGADIDAVCALFSLPVDCAGAVDGKAIIDDCGNCLETEDANFNELCKDCMGIINGSHVYDDCGVCLNINDEQFNESCKDCKGLTNGTNITDDCGVCLLPNDPLFNATCTDCKGNSNGNFAIDNCGLCLSPDDPSFNISCLNIYIPNAFSPNNDGINDRFQLFAKPNESYFIKSYQIFNRWGQKVYEAKDFDIKNSDFWWDGIIGDKLADTSVFIYHIVVEDETKHIKSYNGNVTVIR